MDIYCSILLYKLAFLIIVANDERLLRLMFLKINETSPPYLLHVPHIFHVVVHVSGSSVIISIGLTYRNILRNESR